MTRRLLTCAVLVLVLLAAASAYAQPTFTHRTAGSFNDNGPINETTASLNPGATSTLVVDVGIIFEEGHTPSAPVLSGVATAWGDPIHTSDPINNGELFVYRYRGDGPFSEGTISITHATTGFTGLVWVVTEVSASAPPQDVQSDDFAGSSGMPTVTLAAFAAANNRAMSVQVVQNSAAIDPGTGCTELVEDEWFFGGWRVQTQWCAVDDNVVDTDTVNSSGILLATEFDEGGSGPPPSGGCFFLLLGAGRCE